MRGYSAAINSLHKMFAACDLPMLHGMILALEKAIDRVYSMSKEKARVRLPLTCVSLSRGRRLVASMVRVILR